MDVIYHLYLCFESLQESGNCSAQNILLKFKIWKYEIHNTEQIHKLGLCCII